MPVSAFLVTHGQSIRSRRSCLSNLLGFGEAVTRMIDEGHTVDAIYLKFAKAFDSVNHRFRLAKMKSIGRVVD